MPITIASAILMITPALAAQEPQSAGTIDLVCQGKASKDETPGSAFSTGARVEQRMYYDDSVYLRIRPDNSGEARIPKKLQPAYKQGKDGWFPLVNMTQSPREIDGQVRFQSMYKPKFHVDRITGQLTMSGKLGDFAGQCSKYDASALTTKF